MEARADVPGVPFDFLATPPEESALEGARVVVLPVPYDGTVSFKGGAREGPRAIIEASHHLEDYDPELDADVSQVGIHTAPWLEPHMEGPREMVERVRQAVYPPAAQGKLVALLGGEHTIALGGVKALRSIFPDLSVLYLDAHADLRHQYMGTGWGHASVARRIHELCPLVQVGVRSLSLEEKQFIHREGVRRFPWKDGSVGQPSKEVVACLSPEVYISIDLDVLDPSLMPAVGTPEPGGMGWHQLLSLLRAVAESRRIVAFDVSELSPREGPASCAYTAAKLVYKLMGYATILSGRRGGPRRVGARMTTPG